MMKARIFAKLLAVAFFLVSVFSQISNAEPLRVEIIDSYYHVWGDIRVSNDGDYDPLDYTASYDYSASFPINEHVDYYRAEPVPYGLTYADSQTYEFGLSASTSTGIYYDKAWAFAYAEAEWIFRPRNEVEELKLSILFTDCCFGILRAKIEDMSLGVELWSGKYHIDMVDKNPEFIERTGEISCEIPANPVIASNLQSDHIYRLYFWSESAAVGGDGSGTYIQAPDMKVPEPATLLLLGSGLVGLAGLRRRFKR